MKSTSELMASLGLAIKNAVPAQGDAIIEIPAAILKAESLPYSVTARNPLSVDPIETSAIIINQNPGQVGAGSSATLIGVLTRGIWDIICQCNFYQTPANAILPRPAELVVYNYASLAQMGTIATSFYNVFTGGSFAMGFLSFQGRLTLGDTTAFYINCVGAVGETVTAQSTFQPNRIA